MDKVMGPYSLAEQPQETLSRIFLDQQLATTPDEADRTSYLEVLSVRITPRQLVMANPFEGKVFRETIVIRNCGRRPVKVRILNPSSSGIRIKAIKQGQFLCSGMYIKRTITYKVQMMTLIHSCVIPIYINDDTHVNYKVLMTDTTVSLTIEPSTFVDFGFVDASSTPTKKTLKMINQDVKPMKFVCDLGPNVLELLVAPSRGILLSGESIIIEISIIFLTEGSFSSEFWIITENPTCIHVSAKVGFPRIEPLYTHTMQSFTFVQFPNIYYGTKAVRNIVLYNNSTSQTFFCVLGEVELETQSLKEIRKSVHDYKFFKINPEEGRLLANDVRVFRLTYTPTKAKHKESQSKYHLVMIRIKRLNCKDLNANDYIDDIFLTPRGNESELSEELGTQPSNVSEDASRSTGLDICASHMSGQSPDTVQPISEIRFMLYGQVEEASMTILPDELTLSDLDLNVTTTRVLQLTNNSETLPIIFSYQKVAFVEVHPKIAHLDPSESIELYVDITPKSYSEVNTHIIFDLLYYNDPRDDQELIQVGKIKIPFSMSTKIVPKAKTKSKTDMLLVKNFDFKKPNQRPNDFVMQVLRQGKTYVGLPDDRPANNLPDPKNRVFKTIYAALPRYQFNYNPYELTKRDKTLLKAKNYYNIYINMMATKKAAARSIELNSIKPVKCRVAGKNVEVTEHDPYFTEEFIPLTPIELAQLDITPRNISIENVAFESTFLHTITITNGTSGFLEVFLKPKKPDEFNFINGNRATIAAHSHQAITFLIYVGTTALYNFEMDVIINNCHVMDTSVLVKARPRHLTLSVELLTFYENEPNHKFIELRNELNVDIPFQWKIPNLFKIDPIDGEVVSGRFVACMISFEVGLAENMVYDLGVHTENKYYNLKVLIEGTNYKVKLPKLLPFGELSINVPCFKTLALSNLSPQFLSFKVNERELPDGVKVKPREGTVMPCGYINFNVSINRCVLGDFSGKIEVLVVHTKKVFCEITGTVVFPQLHFRPETIRFRKMAASSFDIACVSVVNTSSAVAMLQFDTERFPEFSYSEYTNTEYMSDQDVIYVNENEEKQFSIHFYPYNPLVTSFPLPVIINKIGGANKSKTMLVWKPSVKVHAQVLSYKLEVKSWRYHFNYFPYFKVKNTTTHSICFKNPGKTLLVFCIRLDELREPFTFMYKAGVNIIQYDCSMVVELQPDQHVVFEASYFPTRPGSHTIRLPVYIREDFTQDMHNYLYLVGEYPAATFKYNETAIYLGFIPLCFTISKKIVVDMAHHEPTCQCVAETDDKFCYAEIDASKPKSVKGSKMVQIIFSASVCHLLSAKLIMSCDCPGSNIEIDIFGGCENNYLTVHACIQFFRFTSTTTYNSMFEATEHEISNMSTITIQDPDKEEATKHTYKTDLPYFQTGTEPFDKYMQQIVAIFEKWIYEQIFYGVRSFSIPDTICIPDVKIFDKQGKREGIIKLPFQLILMNLMGVKIMSQFEIKYSEKKPLYQILRKFYRDILNFLLSNNCFVNMIRPEVLLPYEMYQEYVTTFSRGEVLPAKCFYLIAKQCWLDLLMQAYKSLVCDRLFQTSSATSSAKILAIKSSQSMNVNGTLRRPLSLDSHHYGLSVGSMTIFSETSVTLLLWVDRHFQDHKQHFVSDKFGNTMTPEFSLKHIANFDDDLSDGLGIIAFILTHCSFLEEHIMGIYAPATNRMEKFNNAYIVHKLLNLLQVSFHLQPLDIVEPNTLQMVMFLIYMYEFLIPLKTKETINFLAEMTKSKEESITIFNENRHKIYYNIIFFNNDDDLFSVEESTILIEPEQHFNLSISYFAKFLRVQKTVLLLSGEIPGYQYTNSKIYYLEGRPDLSKLDEPIILKSIVYKIANINIACKSPYPVECDYEIYFSMDLPTDITQLQESMYPYRSVLETKTLTRIKLQSPLASADETGQIAMAGQLCSIINTNRTYWMILRNSIGDFIVTLDVQTKPMKRLTAVKLTIQKSLESFPCTCSRKKPDVHNNKCPRNFKVMIPCRNEYLWKSVMDFFLLGRDPDEAEFWDFYKRTPIGSHIVKRILYDHKKLLSVDMAYFMNQSFKYNVGVKGSDSIVTQRVKVIKEAALVDAQTEVLVHINKTVKSFNLILESEDHKETRSYKVRVEYE